MAVACAACGFVNEPGEDFCGGCGTRLVAPLPVVQAPSASETRFASPERYTPQHLAERVIHSG
jgi:hypothetical protein